MLDDRPSSSGGWIMATQLWRSIGEWELAEQAAKKAMSTDPANVAARLEAAAVLARHAPAEAEKLLADTLQSATPNARITVIRALARLLVYSGRPSKVERAIEMLLELDEEQNSTGDRLLLAKAQEVRQRIKVAKVQLLAATQDAPGQASLLEAYVGFLIRNQLTRELDPQQEQALLGPAAESLDRLRLQCRYLAARNRQNRIQPRIEAFVRAKTQDVTPETLSAVLTATGDMYDEAHLADEAESKFRAAARLTIEGHFALVQWLIRNGRSDEALRLAAQRCEQQPAGRTVAVLILASALCEEQGGTVPASVDAKLASLADRHPDSPELLEARGVLALQREQRDEAEAWFRKSLEIRPDAPPTLNNLAMLLAEDATRNEEAVALIDEAMGQVGRSHGLLATKAFAMLNGSQVREARDLAFEAIARSTDDQEAMDPRYQFYLALALQRLGELEGANGALQKSLDLGLEKFVLTRGERRQLRELERSLKFASGPRASS